MPEPIIPIRSTTQRFTEIEDINHDIAMFSDGSCSMVLSTTAVNFGLLSENEQEALIYAYAGLLNSLSFPGLQIKSPQHPAISSLHRDNIFWLFWQWNLKIQRNPGSASYTTLHQQ
jgi:wyosine [tRNA(Phe)-imidazoG37] synthetase (radical SAM superfamily)